MASSIDPTKPVALVPTTESVRVNFGFAKTEIEALQTGKADDTALDAHLSDAANPHIVTAAQVGAATKIEMAIISVRRWFTRASAANNEWLSVCWSPELRLFVAVAASGTGNRVMTSPDGITWTIRTSAADNFWLSVCWSPELGLFVAVANSGTGNRVMTSL